jgi:hypothetical protein
LPSPWTGRGIQDGRKREAEKNERERERYLISIFWEVLNTLLV